MSATSAGAQLARSWSLREGFARTRLAWLAGRISDDMVRTITTGIPAAIKRLGVADEPALVADIERDLVPFAVESSVAAVRRKLARLRLSLDPDGTDERTIAANDEQQITLTPVGDGFEVRGYLTKESAAAVLTCLDQTVDGLFRDGSLTPERRTLASDDVLSKGRRLMRRAHLNALALAELCGLLLDAGGFGTRHQQRPHVTVTVDAQEYRAGLGGLLHLPGMDGETISAATVDRLLCDADLTTILTAPSSSAAGDRADGWLSDAAREVLYVGRAQRTAHPRLRKALAIRDRHCRFPDCRVAAERCHAHHVTHGEHGGTTDPSNMLLLCHGHHHQVHEGGWVVTRRSGTRDGEPGAWDISRPRIQEGSTTRGHSVPVG